MTNYQIVCQTGILTLSQHYEKCKVQSDTNDEHVIFKKKLFKKDVYFQEIKEIYAIEVQNEFDEALKSKLMESEEKLCEGILLETMKNKQSVSTTVVEALLMDNGHSRYASSIKFAIKELEDQVVPFF